MKPLVIAVAGLAGVGKDTFADGLLGQGVRRIALADNLKMMCQLVFGVTPWHTDTQEGKAAKLETPIVITDKEAWKVLTYMGLTHPQINEMPDCVFNKIQSRLPAKIETTRYLLQFVGTEICREAIVTYHTDILINKVLRPADVAGWVVTDCRFGDERANFKERAGAQLVLIKRPGFAPKSNHASENSLGLESEYDFVIDNNGSIQDLHLAAGNLLRSILGVYS